MPTKLFTKIGDGRGLPHGHSLLTSDRGWDFFLHVTSIFQDHFKRYHSRPRRPVGVSMAAERKTKLSKNLLHMKFMQRGLDSETKKQLEEEEKKIISEEHWYLDLPELKEKE